MTWEEWLEELSVASGGHIDYWLLDEESAKAHHPNLYEYYKIGYDVNDLISERLMSYEGDVLIWLDPDDSGDIDGDIDENQLDAILSNTEFYKTFSEENSNLKVLNSLNIAEEKLRITLKKQIYIAAITCLETYLSDALINTVLSNDKYIKSFFYSFKDFKEQKISLNELFNYAQNAEEIAKKAMLNLIYHNLPKISSLYKAILDISFPDFSKVQKDIVNRHDLVHRNGKTKKGEHIVINEKFVYEVICRIENFVNEIDQKLNSLPE